MLSADDHLAIIDCINVTAYAYDLRDWDDFARFWAADAVFVNATDETCSVRAVVDLFRGFREVLAEEGIQTRHAQTNTVLRADDGRVQGRTLLTVY